ncbi:MAG: type IV pilus twitching motility protein PilT [Candidatus Rokubacteria bacterium]|nr:type IV pilus twitching motility protein PilT [Candidatus Rokubacteria bacterium]
MRDLLMVMAERSASDLHITASAPPTLRVHGRLVPLEYPPLTPDQTKALAYSLITTEQRERFEANHELDFSYGVTGLSRYRVNVYQQRGAVGIAIRSIPHQPKGFEELGLPSEICNTLISKHKGLVLITGPTGHGKTTTMASMIDRINRARDVHIVTVEDPLEYLYANHKALVNQREVGQDTHSFPAALKYVLRQDPDVVLIGEMRDLETIQAALTIGETGHLTFATLHTNSCAQSIDRVIDVFPPHQQSQVRAQLALVLEAIFNQLLIPRKDGRGRVLALEILMATPAIRNMIREEKVHQIYSAMQAGQKFGMQTMNQALANLYLRGLITRQEAVSRSLFADELLRLIEQPQVASR